MHYVFIDKNGEELNLEWTSDIKYPFLSPFEVLFTKGRPVGKIAYLALEYEKKQYAFGTIVYSESEKFIFFNGLTDSRIHDTLSNKKGELSHIALEANKDKFHIKFKETSTKAPIFRTDEIEKDYFYWFSLALSHPTTLLPLKHLKYKFDAPKGNGTRRVNEIGISYKDITHKILTIPEKKLYDDEFLDFDFYITKQDIDETNTKLIPPTKIPPRTQMVKMYTVDLIETDFKFGICISRMRPKEALENNLARIYHHEYVRKYLKKNDLDNTFPKKYL